MLFCTMKKLRGIRMTLKMEWLWFLLHRFDTRCGGLNENGWSYHTVSYHTRTLIGNKCHFIEPQFSKLSDAMAWHEFLDISTLSARPRISINEGYSSWTLIRCYYRISGRCLFWAVIFIENPQIFCFSLLKSLVQKQMHYFPIEGNYFPFPRVDNEREASGWQELGVI